jgi:hypothetical protein
MRYRRITHFWKYLEFLGKTHGRFGKKKNFCHKKGQKEAKRQKALTIDY